MATTTTKEIIKITNIDKDEENKSSIREILK